MHPGRPPAKMISRFDLSLWMDSDYNAGATLKETTREFKMKSGPTDRDGLYFCDSLRIHSRAEKAEACPEFPHG